MNPLQKAIVKELKFGIPMSSRDLALALDVPKSRIISAMRVMSREKAVEEGYRERYHNHNMVVYWVLGPNADKPIAKPHQQPVRDVNIKRRLGSLDEVPFMHWYEAGTPYKPMRKEGAT